MGACLCCMGKKSSTIDEVNGDVKIISENSAKKRMNENLQCCSNPPRNDSSSVDNGIFVDAYGGVRAYITGSPESGAAVILIPDVFGCDALLMRKLADKVASAGFFVVVPDFFDGKPFNPSGAPLMEWLKEHPAQEGLNVAKPVVDTLRSKAFKAIGAAGFCWGAKVVAELAKCNYIEAAVMLHPSFVTPEDIKEAKCHIAILGAEHDHVSPPTLIREFGEILKTKEVKSYVRIYSGVSHGWTIRYETSDERARQRAEEAHKQMIDWFAEYLIKQQTNGANKVRL